jgi:hypothetical protein
MPFPSGNGMEQVDVPVEAEQAKAVPFTSPEMIKFFPCGSFALKSRNNEPVHQLFDPH